MRSILFCVTKGNWGGAQKYVYDLSKSLPKSEYTREVLLGEPGVLAEKLRESSIPVKILPELSRDVSPIHDLKVFFKLLKIFWRKRPDIIHLNSSKISGLGALAARLSPVKKIIFTAHGLPHRELWRPSGVRTLIYILSMLTVYLSHITIVTTEADRRDLSRAPFTKKRVRLIPLGTQSVVFLGREEARARLRIKSGKEFILGTIAELHPNKNISEAIKAVASHNRRPVEKIRYVVIGGGELTAELIKLADKEGVSKYIDFMGFIPNAPSLLKAFDGYLMPSVKEAVSYALLEAGLAGLPVVVTPVGGMVDVVKNSYNGIVARNTSSEAIEEALAALMSTPFRSSFAERLRNTVTENYSFEKMLSETIKTYS